MSEAEPPGLPSERMILVIDDDEDVRSFVELTAKMEGFRVAVAADGREASKILDQALPDLIVTDLMMEGQGGYEFIRGLQERGNGGIPVFVVSGSNLDPSTISMIRQEANVVHFFDKPIHVMPFMSAVHKCLNTAPPGAKPPGS